MATVPTPITLPDLTTATVSGTGVFDTLMRAAKGHLDCEFSANRIKGPEYAQVYLGSLTQVLQSSIQFLLEKDKAALEAELVAAQVALANAQLAKTNAEIELVGVEVLKAEAELLLLQQQLPKIAAEIALMTAQTAKVTQDTANAVIEGANLLKQGCVLDAQFDLISQQVLKTTQETALMLQKVATERAQTVAAGVDADSVVGKQKGLYGAQTEGFARNAEQQVAKILIDTWNVRRTTDEGTVADATNKLYDASIGAAVTKLMAGVGIV